MLLLELIQLAIYSLAIALFIVYCSRLPLYSLFISSMLFLILLGLENIVPLYRGSSLVELLRGAVGDVSVTSGLVMLLIIFNQLRCKEPCTPVLTGIERFGLCLIGALLYLSTFGIIGLDFYQWGYLSKVMLFSVAALSMILILGNRPLGYIWTVALIAFYYHAQSSNNLWDYLLDPVLWLVLSIERIWHLINYWRA